MKSVAAFPRKCIPLVDYEFREAWQKILSFYYPSAWLIAKLEIISNCSIVNLQGVIGGRSCLVYQGIYQKNRIMGKLGSMLRLS